MLFEIDSDFGMAEKIIDKVISMKTDNGLPILPSTKNVKNQKCYEKACNMLWSIYDGAFFKKYTIIERKDYNMTDWKDKIINCVNDWSQIHCLVVGSVKNFYRSLFPEYSPQNKKFLKTITFSNFFETGLNQSMFINCINPPLESMKFLRNRKVDSIKSGISDTDLKYGEKFFNKYIVESDYSMVYWQGIKDISTWWKWFQKYTTFGFDVKGNLENQNIICDYCKYIGEYLERTKKECKTYYFKIYEDTPYIYESMFRGYLNTDRFEVVKLPKPLWYYGCEERFKDLISKPKSKIIKIDDKEESSFIDNLED